MMCSSIWRRHRKRLLSKNNYLIYTDVVKRDIIPQYNYMQQPDWLAYAGEADILNVILFNSMAKEWRDLNPELTKKNNIIDFASLKALKEIADYQLSVLTVADSMKRIESK